jgi:hypothetical protein
MPAAMPDKMQERQIDPIMEWRRFEEKFERNEKNAAA